MDKQDQETDDKYILVPESEINENLKRDIVNKKRYSKFGRSRRSILQKSSAQI